MLVKLINKVFFGRSSIGPLNMTTRDFIESVTKNKDLQTIFCYNWGDYGTTPAQSRKVFKKNDMFITVKGATEQGCYILF